MSAQGTRIKRSVPFHLIALRKQKAFHEKQAGKIESLREEGVVDSGVHCNKWWLFFYCYYCNTLTSEERIKRLNFSILGMPWMKRFIEPVLFYQDMYAYSLSIDRTDKSFRYSFHVCVLRQDLAIPEDQLGFVVLLSCCAVWKIHDDNRCRAHHS